MNERLQDLLYDARKYLKQAGADWLETVKTDPIQHAFSFAAGGVLVTAILAVL